MGNKEIKNTSFTKVGFEEEQGMQRLYMSAGVCVLR